MAFGLSYRTFFVSTRLHRVGNHLAHNVCVLPFLEALPSFRTHLHRHGWNGDCVTSSFFVALIAPWMSHRTKTHSLFLLFHSQSFLRSVYYSGMCFTAGAPVTVHAYGNEPPSRAWLATILKWSLRALGNTCNEYLLDNAAVMPGPTINSVFALSIRSSLNDCYCSFVFCPFF